MFIFINYFIIFSMCNKPLPLGMIKYIIKGRSP